jgi:hypothetical protein
MDVSPRLQMSAVRVTRMKDTVRADLFALKGHSVAPDRRRFCAAGSAIKTARAAVLTVAFVLEVVCAAVRLEDVVLQDTLASEAYVIKEISLRRHTRRFALGLTRADLVDLADLASHPYSIRQVAQYDRKVSAMAAE